MVAAAAALHSARAAPPVYQYPEGRWTQIIATGAVPIITPGTTLGPAGPWHAAAAVAGGLAIIGGDGLGNGTYHFDPARDAWSRLSDVPVSDLDGAGVAVMGGMLTLTGGSGYGAAGSAFALSTSSAGAPWAGLTLTGGPAAPRSGHRVSTLGNLAFMWGGYDAAGYHNDLFTVDLSGDVAAAAAAAAAAAGGGAAPAAPGSAAWMPIPLSGSGSGSGSGVAAPAPRAFHSMDVVGGTLLVVIGGFNHNAATGLFPPTAPWAACATVPGMDCTAYDDVWVWAPGAGAAITQPGSTAAWTLLQPRSVSGSSPEPRWGHATGVLGHAIYMYGGLSLSSLGTSLTDLWMLDLSAGSALWAPVVSRDGQPSSGLGLYSGAMLGGSFYMFAAAAAGGGGASTVGTELWRFDPSPSWMIEPVCDPTGTAVRAAETVAAATLHAAHGLGVGITFAVLFSFSALVFAALSWCAVRPKGGAGAGSCSGLGGGFSGMGAGVGSLRARLLRSFGGSSAGHAGIRSSVTGGGDGGGGGGVGLDGSSSHDAIYDRL